MDVLGNVNIKSKLEVLELGDFKQDINVSNNLDIGNHAVIRENVDVLGNVNVKSKLDVLGLGEFREDVNIYGNVDISKEFKCI